MRLDGLKEAVATPGAAALDEARYGFARTQPHRSAKRGLYFTQLVAIAALIGALVFAARLAPVLTFEALHIAGFVIFAAAILFRLIAASSLTPLLSRIADQRDVPIYTILCPLYREANVTPDLVAALSRIDYPTDRLDIKLLVEGDDVDTIAAALAVSGAPHIEVVIIPACAPRTKPKALNVGLSRARGEFIVVYDAEDHPHPQQLRAALAAFEDNGDSLICVQAPLAIDNPNASWIARQFAAEYAIQFREILPFLASIGAPLPLGGTSNHFRTEVLRQVGAWDPFNVSEDRANFANKLNRFRERASHVPFVSHSCASAA
ncbi:MAG: glycosyltransferase [Hyphomonadaceae bacterium]